MRAKGILEVRGLIRLKNISWLSAQRVERLARALIVRTVEKREIIFDEKNVPESVYILLSGIARITCRNRKGQRRLVIMVAPGMISGLPLPVNGISYELRGVHQVPEQLRQPLTVPLAGQISASSEIDGDVRIGALNLIDDL